MPKCQICNTRFWNASHYDPAEDCDCGQCIDSFTASGMTNDELMEAHDFWALYKDGWDVDEIEAMLEEEDDDADDP